MCGICGFIPQDFKTIPAHSIIENMCAQLQHRGPDDTGIFVSQGVGLGHQRLKVIDLVTGQQPMTDLSKRYTIVFNGEIYNYQELRQHLKQKGYIFTSQSDTEVLLHGLMAEGSDFLHKTNGMFAFALWDAHEKTLLLARDRFGVKPLYYAHIPGEGVYFASEASAIALVSPQASQVCPESARTYLAFSYIPGEQSIFKNIQKVREGGYILIKNSTITQQATWWDLREEWAQNLATPSPQNWQENFHATLEDAVKIRLKADVPLGVFLSGGVDSATVAALASAHCPGILSFTMAFQDASYNEAPFAYETAKALGTDHHEALADFGSQEELLQVVNKLDEPFADTSIIPMNSLCKLARQHVTVALTGDGADELLGGYITHRANELYRKIRYVPALVVKILRSCISLLPDSHQKVNTVFKLKQFLAAHPRPEQLAHACWRLLFYADTLSEIFPHLTVPADIFSFFQKAWEESRGLAHLDRFLYVDYKTWLAHDILFKVDRASMHNSLELRSPFLDYRLFKLCSTMPTHYKRQGSQGKIILKDMAAQLLPASCLQRPKTGFNAPVAGWLVKEWKTLSEESFSVQSLEIAGLNPAPIIRLWEEHKKGWYSHGYQLFNILILTLWQKQLRQKNNFHRT